MFQAYMIQQSGNFSVSGQITVDPNANDGSGTLQLTNAANSGNYSLQFCPYPSPLPTAQQNPCTAITDFTTDNSGKAQVNFQFPKKGVWSGIFVAVRGDITEFASGFNLPGAGQQYRAALQQASSVTSGTGGINPGGDALKSGSVSVTDTTAHVVLQNATINVTYSVIFCGNGGGSSCYGIGSLTTDSTGSGTADIDLVKALGNFSPPGIFRLDRSQPLPTGGDAGGVQFMTGFVVM